MRTLCDAKKRRLELGEYQTFLKKGTGRAFAFAFAFAIWRKKVPGTL